MCHVAPGMFFMLLLVKCDKLTPLLRVCIFYGKIGNNGCERSRRSLSQLGCWHDRERTPLQDWDHSENDPRLVPDFLRQRSGMFPERFWRMSVPVSSRENRPTWTEHPRCGIPSY